MKGIGVVGCEWEKEFLYQGVVVGWRDGGTQILLLKYNYYFPTRGLVSAFNSSSAAT